MLSAVNDQESFLSNGSVKDIASGMLRNLKVIEKQVKKIMVFS